MFINIIVISNTSNFNINLEIATVKSYTLLFRILNLTRNKIHEHVVEIFYYTRMQFFSRCDSQLIKFYI